MFEYLINIVLASRSYWTVAIVLFVAYSFLPWNKFHADVIPYRTWVKNASIFIFVIGVFVGVTSPSNTYKHGVDYNKTQDLKRIQQLNESRAARAPEINDISRQPLSPEDRAANAIDMRERVITESIE